VSNGSGHALSLAFSAFVDVGDAILSEAPTFSGTLATIRRHGARVLDVRWTPKAWSRAWPASSSKSSGAKASRASSSTPSSISRTRRADHVAPAARGADRAGARVRDGHPRGRRLRRAALRGQQHRRSYALDKGGRTIRAGTLSKILGAGVRLGWLCAPRQLIPAFQGFLFGGGVNPTSRAWRPSTCATTSCPTWLVSWTSTAPSATPC